MQKKNIFQKLKLLIGNFRFEHILFITSFINLLLGISFRYTVYFLSPNIFNSCFGNDWEIYNFFTIKYLLKKLLLLFILIPLFKSLNNLFYNFYNKCVIYKNDYYQKYIGFIEWDEMGCNNITKDYELNNGDIMCIEIFNKFLSSDFLESENRRDKLLNILLSNSLNDEYNLYYFINTFTDYKVKHMQTIQIFKRNILRYIQDKYYIQKSLLKLNKYKEDLIKKTCHPDRFLEWCEPKYLDDF